MNKMILKLVIAGYLFSTGMVMAELESIPAKLVVSGRIWKGKILNRDGEMINYQRDGKTSPIGLAVTSVDEILFDIEIDSKEITQLMADREFEQVILVLKNALNPFTEYADLLSNLTKYNSLLMEMYYRTEEYDESLKISSKISKDDRDLKLKEKNRVFQLLALIDAERVSEAITLRESYGWDQNPSDDAPPEQLYIAAKLLVSKEEYEQAMETVAKVIAFNGQNLEWMKPAELLCAEVYTKLGLYDSAMVVCLQIEALYKNSMEADKVKLLKVEIEGLRAEEKKIEEDLKSK